MKYHGYNPEDAIIQVSPRPGESILRTRDILDILQQHGHEIATVCFSGIQYYTGQLFDIEKITLAAHDQVK